MTSQGVKLDVPTRVLHIGLAVFGTWAWWIGDGAHDFHKPDHSGYVLHMYVGLAFSAVLAMRLLYGFFGPQALRFAAWVPYTRERFAYVKQDLQTLLCFKMPEPVTHRGLNAAVQSLGLLLFTWQGASGTLMSLLIVPGERTSGWLHTVQDLHGTGSVWIPTYLVLHVGGALLHALSGQHIWRKMIFLSE